jgi:transposase-like protein
VDETYIRDRGRWTNLYRAVDRRGLTADSLLSGHRDIAAATRLFIRAIERRGAPERITLDGYPATHSAVAELKGSGALRPQAQARTSKYSNDLVGQDHRRARRRIYPMPGFKNFRNAAVTSGGVGLAREIRKGRFNITRLEGGVKVRMPQVWDAVPAD